MKNLPLVVILISILICSCSTPPEKKTSNAVTDEDDHAPLEVTVIADLWDSLQPKTFLMEKMPKPITVAIPLVLGDEKGAPVLDTDGKPFIMGDGGKSNFTKELMSEIKFPPRPLLI